MNLFIKNILSTFLLVLWSCIGSVHAKNEVASNNISAPISQSSLKIAPAPVPGPQGSTPQLSLALSNWLSYYSEHLPKQRRNQILKAAKSYQTAISNDLKTSSQPLSSNS